MRIELDGQLFAEKEKTGIGFVAHQLVCELPRISRDEKVLDYFAKGCGGEQLAAIEQYQEMGYALNPCQMISSRHYKMIWPFFPLAFHRFFGKKADVTCFFNFYVPPGVSGKKITIVHDMVVKAFPETMNLKTKIMLKLCLKKSCKRADKIVTVSQFSKEEIVKYLKIPEEKIIVMPNGVDHSLYHPGYAADAVEKAKRRYQIEGEYYLYLGTLEPRKNIERIVQAYARSKKPGGPRLVLAGRKGWLYESIFAAVQELGIERDVIFTDYVADADVPLLMSGAKIFLFPSLYEGFGLPPLEAMACGTPVVTASTSSLPEVAGDAALLADPYSVREIAAAIARLEQDEALRQSLIQKGLERAAQFTWEKSAQIFYAAIKSAAAEEKK